MNYIPLTTPAEFFCLIETFNLEGSDCKHKFTATLRQVLEQTDTPGPDDGEPTLYCKVLRSKNENVHKEQRMTKQQN